MSLSIGEMTDDTLDSCLGRSSHLVGSIVNPETSDMRSGTGEEYESIRSAGAGTGFLANILSKPCAIGGLQAGEAALVTKRP